MLTNLDQRHQLVSILLLQRSIKINSGPNYDVYEYERQ